MLQQFLLLVLFAGLFTCDAAAPIFRAAASGGEAIPGRYIVSFRGHILHNQITQHIGVVKELIQLHPGYFVDHVYDMPNWSGYSVYAPSNVLNFIINSPLVEFVEEDQVMKTNACQVQNPTGSWGVDRIDSHTKTLNNQYNYSLDTAGQGVTAYVIDTGIDITHPDFGGRASWGVTIPQGGTSTDCNGHGTHVAGTIGSNTYGVAKKVTLVAVKVLGCDGSGALSDVIAGVNWVASNAKTPSKSVANMSLGGGTSNSLSNAVTAAINTGVLFAVAAGNNNGDACSSSPANVGAALTVGATTSSDARASYSNYGACVDIFAPGSDIVSTWPGGGTNTISGTSMATPHVTGVAAILRSATPGAQASAVTSLGTANAVSLSCSLVALRCRSTTTRLLYSAC